MPAVHRSDDLRSCGASTITSLQSTVRINGKIASVEGDSETHGSGQLISASAGTVKFGGYKAIVVGDSSTADNVPHLPAITKPSTGSPDVNLY